MNYRTPLLLLALLLCLPVFGQMGPVDAEGQSVPCFWDDGICFSYQEQAEGMGAGSAAPGMNSCTSTVGCKKCVVKDGETQESCSTEKWADGFCKCGITSAGSCQASGACTYVQ